MSSRSHPVARRYAEAMAELTAPLAEDEKRAVREQLVGLREAIEGSFDLRNVLSNPSIDGQARAKVLEAVLQTLDIEGVVRRFVGLISDRGRSELLGSIVSAYESMDDERLGVERGRLTSAIELGPDMVEKIRRALEKRTGKRIELSLVVDPEVIGGVRAEVGSMVFDGTIRSELDRMRDQLEAPFEAGPVQG
ncbi:MAG: ATP synthase F1 subunit delta [Myxococcota bacterium]